MVIQIPSVSNGILFFMFVMSLVLSSCDSGNNVRQQAQRITDNTQSDGTGEIIVFHCEQDFRFTVQVDSDTALLFLKQDTIVLEKSASGSGAKYVADGYLFWSKGDSAILGIGDRQYLLCANVPSTAVWQAAALRGIDFRATGNEPGWHLEMEYGEQVRLVTMYGEKSYTFITPDVTQPDKFPVEYFFSNGKDSLQVEILSTPCQDSMSGVEHPFTVLLNLNGNQLRGCGRELPI